MNVILSSTLLSLALVKQQKRIDKLKVKKMKIETLKLMAELNA
jgi:hypothetical protein